MKWRDSATLLYLAQKFVRKVMDIKGTWETIQFYTLTQIKGKEQLVVRKDMDVNEHERLSYITLRHKLK